MLTRLILFVAVVHLAQCFFIKDVHEMKSSVIKGIQKDKEALVRQYVPRTYFQDWTFPSFSGWFQDDEDDEVNKKLMQRIEDMEKTLKETRELLKQLTSKGETRNMKFPTMRNAEIVTNKEPNDREQLGATAFTVNNKRGSYTNVVVASLAAFDSSDEETQLSRNAGDDAAASSSSNTSPRLKITEYIIEITRPDVPSRSDAKYHEDTGETLRTVVQSSDYSETTNPTTTTHPLPHFFYPTYSHGIVDILRPESFSERLDNRTKYFEQIQGQIKENVNEAVEASAFDDRIFQIFDRATEQTQDELCKGCPSRIPNTIQTISELITVLTTNNLTDIIAAAAHEAFDLGGDSTTPQPAAPNNTPSKNEEKPQNDAPKTEAPKTEAPKTEAPKTEAPKTEAPKTEAPKTEAPKTEAPKTEAPKTETPKTEAPKTEAPKTEAPKTEAPKTEDPKTEAPKTEAPKTEAPKTEVPQADAPKPEDSKPADSNAEEAKPDMMKN